MSATSNVLRTARHPTRRLRRRLTVLGLFLGLTALVVSLDPLFVWFSGLIIDLEPVMQRHPVAGGVIFAGLAAISAFMAFFSSTVLVPVAVHAWGAPLTFALLWSGWIVGGMIAYGLGRRLGRPMARALAGDERLDYYEARFSQRAPFWMILLLHLALQSEIPGLVLGLVRYQFARFLLALGLSELLYAVGVVYMGRFFLERQVGLLVAAAAGAIAAAAWAFHILHRTLDPDDRPAPSPADGRGTDEVNPS